MVIKCYHMKPTLLIIIVTFQSILLGFDNSNNYNKDVNYMTHGDICGHHMVNSIQTIGHLESGRQIGFPLELIL